jgi:hypothetical protein
MVFCQIILDAFTLAPEARIGVIISGGNVDLAQVGTLYAKLPAFASLI